MQILVTGGAGYIGSHTVKALQQSGHEVIVFDSLENGHPESLPAFELAKNLFKGNLLDNDELDSLFQQFKFDAVIHFAAYIEAGESVKVPGKFFWNNTAGTINLLNTMNAYEVNRLVFSSTAAVYGQPKESPIPESAVKDPTNPYGRSKLLIEEALKDLTTFTPLRATVLRYFNAAGCDPDGQLGENHEPETHLIPLVLQVATGKRDHIKLFGTDYPTPDGTCVRDYIHVSDLAEAHVLALETLDSASEPLRRYNVGTGKGYSVKEIIETCRTVTGHTIPAQEEPRREGDPAELVADSIKLQKELNWKPQHSELTTIIKSAWNWHQKHPNGY